MYDGESGGPTQSSVKVSQVGFCLTLVYRRLCDLTQCKWHFAKITNAFLYIYRVKSPKNLMHRPDLLQSGKRLKGAYPLRMLLELLESVASYLFTFSFITFILAFCYLHSNLNEHNQLKPVNSSAL